MSIRPCLQHKQLDYTGSKDAGTQACRSAWQGQEVWKQLPKERHALTSTTTISASKATSTATAAAKATSAATTATAAPTSTAGGVQVYLEVSTCRLCAIKLTGLVLQFHTTVGRSLQREWLILLSMPTQKLQLLPANPEIVSFCGRLVLAAGMLGVRSGMSADLR